MTGEGFRKILKNGSTKEATVKQIADHLGVHWSEVSEEAPLPLTFKEGNTEKQIESLREEIIRHEKQISELKDMIIDIYKRFGSSPS